MTTRRRAWLPLYIAVATTLDLLGLIGFGLSSASQSDIATNKHLLQISCENTAQIARIERVSITQQDQQTALLVKRGFTFGIPKRQFDRLIAQSHAQRQQFLMSLDDLTTANCRKLAR